MKVKRYVSKSYVKEGCADLVAVCLDEKMASKLVAWVQKENRRSKRRGEEGISYVIHVEPRSTTSMSS